MYGNKFDIIHNKMKKKLTEFVIPVLMNFVVQIKLNELYVTSNNICRRIGNS